MLIQNITNELTYRHHLEPGAVTEAIAYVIFNQHGQELVCDCTVTQDMIREASLFVANKARAFFDQFAPPRDPRTLIARYRTRSGAIHEVKHELWLYSSIGEISRQCWQLAQERGYQRGQLSFRITT